MAENGARRIRLGMVGGGSGAFIGSVHRIASRIDGDYELLAGAFSSSPEVSRESGAAIGLDPVRVYENYEAMARAEAGRPDGIEAVAIVTPNHLHAGPTKTFLEAGIHVICDKPLTATVADARMLAQVRPARGARFLLTHNYTGYPLIRQAREMVARGLLGRLRMINVEYAQDWLTQPVDSKQAEWRLDPARSGAGGAIGDIGTHAYNLMRFVTGLRPESLAADLTALVEGRRLDDNVNIMLRFADGARGLLWASQVAPGSGNGLRLRVFGDKGGIDWNQEDPNRLFWTPFGEPRQTLVRGGPMASVGGPAPGTGIRVPAGHPEGYLEGFATLYAEFAALIRGEAEAGQLLPTLADGLEGMAFIDAAVRSSHDDAAWTKLALP
jgi:predicted dehydrogenase